jgi:multidrug efflux pump subunit AcrA (membrane-fusion protein)
MKPLRNFWKWLTARKRRFAVALVIVLIVVFGGWRVIAARNSSKNQYQTSTVQKGTVVSTISASGNAISTSILPINTEASGIVAKVYVKDGDKVVKGQKIADITLDTTGEQNYAQAYSSYLSATNALNNANNSYYTLQAAAYKASNAFSTDPSLQDLKTDDPLYVQANDAWLAAQANFLNQKITVAQASSSLTNASINLQAASPTITAPYTGSISNINLVEGMVITASTNSNTGAVSSQRIAVIKNQATPIVNVTVGETDVPNIKVGQKAEVTFDSISGETFTGVVATVDRIGTVSNNVTSYGVNIKLDSGSDLILPNMAATANIITASATDALYINSASLITQNGQTLARTLVNGKEVDIPVETGISDDTNTVITSGLTEGQTVIIGTSGGTTTTGGATGTSVFSNTFRGVGGGTQVRVSSGAGGR